MHVLDDVKQIISAQIGVPAKDLSAASRLDAVGVESLDVIEIVFALEEKYKITIPYNANESAAAAFRTIGDVADAVSNLIATKQPT